MSVLVFGSTGFLGQHIVSALQAAGQFVRTAGRSAAVDLTCDVLNDEDLQRVIRETEPSVVINLLGAGLSDPNVDAAMMQQINALTPVRIAQAIAEQDSAIAFIHASSSTEEVAPSGAYESQYSATKAKGTRALTEFARSSSQPVTVLRVHNTYGPDQPANRFIASVVDRCLVHDEIVLRHPDRIRDFIYVTDVAAAFVQATQEIGVGIQTFDVGTGIGTSLLDVAQRVAVITGNEPALIGSHTNPATDIHQKSVALPEHLLRHATIDLEQGLQQMVQARREGMQTR